MIRTLGMRLYTHPLFLSQLDQDQTFRLSHIYMVIFICQGTENS